MSRHTTPRIRATYCRYGGDYGEFVHDAQFCVNGLNFPDRTPHPAMHEVKRVHRPVVATETDLTTMADVWDSWLRPVGYFKVAGLDCHGPVRARLTAVPMDPRVIPSVDHI